MLNFNLYLNFPALNVCKGDVIKAICTLHQIMWPTINSVKKKVFSFCLGFARAALHLPLNLESYWLSWRQSWTKYNRIWQNKTKLDNISKCHAIVGFFSLTNKTVTLKHKIKLECHLLRPLDPCGDFVLCALRALRLWNTVVFPSLKSEVKSCYGLTDIRMEGRNSIFPFYVLIYTYQFAVEDQ